VSDTDTSEIIDDSDGSDDADEAEGPGQAPTSHRRWRRPDRITVLMILLLLIGSLLVVRGLLVGITGDERADLPTYIESVQPVPEAVQVLNQSNVFVDLAEGYTGVLVIDGTELDTVDIEDLAQDDVEPGQQIELPAVTRYEQGNATLTFTPNASAPITQFVDGEHTVEVIYWRIEDGRRFARSYTWTFTVV
jgi:hypothetical protein